MSAKEKKIKMFVGMQEIRKNIPNIKTFELLKKMGNKYLNKKDPEFKNVITGLKYEWRAYWYINKWLNKTKKNYYIFMSDLKSDLKGVDIFAVSVNEKEQNTATVKYTFQVKPIGQDLDQDDYPHITHFVLVGSNVIQIKKNEGTINEKN